MNIDRDLSLFARIVEAGSLAGAGRSIGVSPAMVSKRLARLERRLGVRLIDRTTRTLALTPRGERFHRDVVAILEALAQAEARAADSLPAPSGPLSVSAPTSFGRMHLAPLIRAFLERHPAIDLRIDLSDDYVDLSGYDLAIRISAEIPATFTAHRLAASRRILCAAPAYLAAHGIPTNPDELQHHRLLAADGQLPWRLNDGNSVVGTSHVRTNSSEVVRELAVAGVGIALRSLWDVTTELADGRLVRIIPDAEGASDVAIYAVHRRGAPSRGAAALIRYLSELWSPTPPWDAVSPPPAGTS